jgi:nicotinamidase-related amidase
MTMNPQTALVILDAQMNMFAEQYPAFGSAALLQTICMLVGKAHTAGVPVIYIQNNGGIGDPDQPGTPGWELHPALTILPGDCVLQKTTPDAFAGTPLQQELAGRCIKRLVLMGLQTEICIAATCQQAHTLGYDVILVQDGHSTFDGQHTTAAQLIAAYNAKLQAFAQIVTAAQISFAAQPEAWRAYLKNDPLPWLLEPNNPSVRYYALTELLDKPFSDPDVQTAQAAILQDPVVVEILHQQHDAGYWGRADRYLARFTGTVWQWLLLLEFGCDPQHAAIQKAARFLLETAFDPEQGGFVSRKGSTLVPCYHGLLLWGGFRCQLATDPHIQTGLQWIVQKMHFRDGDAQVPNPDDGCLGRHTCIRGALPILQALAEIPAIMLTPELAQIRRAGVEFLLRHHLYKRSHNLAKPMNAYLTRFTFPGFYYPDVLHALLLLTQLGYHDARMSAAVQVILKKQDNDGRWKMQRAYQERRPRDLFPVLVPIETRGQPSKWITLRALIALKRWAQMPSD